MNKEEEKFIEVYKEGDFSRWLAKNHSKENHVLVILHKKHTGKNKTSAAELMKEAICYGWIDTTAKRIDEDRWGINYRKRNKNANWSYNTLSYAKKLIKDGKMKPSGMSAYLEGKKKLPHDHGIPENPEVPEELKKALSKNKKAKENFEKLSNSARKTYLRWLFRAKMPETKKKRIKLIIQNMIDGKKKVDVSLKDI